MGCLDRCECDETSAHQLRCMFVIVGFIAIVTLLSLICYIIGGNSTRFMFGVVLFFFMLTIVFLLTFILMVLGFPRLSAEQVEPSRAAELQEVVLDTAESPRPTEPMEPMVTDPPDRPFLAQLAGLSSLSTYPYYEIK